MNNLQSFAGQFVSSTRRYLLVRPEDGVLILRPNKVHHLNWQHRTPKASG
jgi:RecB family endonuclease NucS